MRNLSRAVLDDAIEMTLRSGRLSDEQRVGLLQRLRQVRDGFCEKCMRCADCPARCACEDLVRQAFAGDVSKRRVGE
jgi:hypothetical protein